MLSLRLLMGAALGGDMGAEIKSIQQGIIELGGVISATAAINEVDLSKAVCLFTGSRAADGGPNNVFCGVALTSSIQVTGYKSIVTGTAHVGFTVIEFLTGIESSQRGVIQIITPDVITDETISEVDISKTLLGFGGYRGYEGTNESLIATTLELVNSTTLRATRGSGINRTATVYYDLLEFE